MQDTEALLQFGDIVWLRQSKYLEGTLDDVYAEAASSYSVQKNLVLTSILRYKTTREIWQYAPRRCSSYRLTNFKRMRRLQFNWWNSNTLYLDTVLGGRGHCFAWHGMIPTRSF
jgi:hypothetical protein